MEFYLDRRFYKTKNQKIKIKIKFIVKISKNLIILSTLHNYLNLIKEKNPDLERKKIVKVIKLIMKLSMKVIISKNPH